MRRCIAVDLNVVLGEFEDPDGAVVYIDAAQGLECGGCGDWSHRRCLGLAAAAYPGGTFVCRRCLLAYAALEELAGKAVAAAGSAVAESSAET